MFHNLTAKHPVPDELFPTIAHHHFREELRHMELKDSVAVAGVVIAAVGVVVAILVAVIHWLKYRHDVHSRQEDAEPRPAKPFVNVTHTITRSSIAPDAHSLKLEISNRDQRPIAVQEVCWYVKSFRTRWPVSYRSASLPTEPEALHQYKIQTAELLQLNIDITNIFKPLSATRGLSLLDTVVAIATLDIGVILTTGESIPQGVPWTFRTFLAGQFVRPSWLAPLVKLYVWARP